jgi:hypothetical protein
MEWKIFHVVGYVKKKIFPPTTVSHNATSLIFNTQQLEYTLGSIGSVILEGNYCSKFLYATW